MRMTRHLPSLEALVADDDAQMTAELSLLEAREHVAQARALLDHAAGLAPDPDDPAHATVELTSRDVPPEAVAEQLARLGYRMVAIATALRRTR